MIDTLKLPRLAIAGITIRRPFVLMTIGAASLLFYFFGLLLPYNIFALKLVPLLDVSKLTRQQPITQTAFVFTFAALFALYYLAWHTCRGSQSRAMWITVIGIAVAINLTMVFLYPIGAADIFDNIIRGRMFVYHGLNPVYDVPQSIPADPFFLYIAWLYYPSAYGALWELAAAGLSFIAGDSIVANIIVFKLFSITFYFLSIFVIAKTLRQIAPERALSGVCFFALNPLVLYETAGNGHNDVVMTFFILWALYLFVQRRFTLVLLSLTAGALIKFVPALLLPIFFVALLRALPTRQQRWRFTLISAVACALLVMAAYLFFWRGGDVFGIGRRSGLFTASLPAILQAHLENYFNNDFIGRWQSEQIVSGAAFALMIGVVLAQTYRARLAAAPSDLIRIVTRVMLFYILVACLWFQQWYAIWPLALAALLPEGALSRLAALITFTSPWKMIVFDFFLVPNGNLPPRIWRETWLGVSTFGIAWLYALYVVWRRWKETHA